MIIVPMAERHISVLAEIEQACFSEPWSASSLREELENRRALFLVAEDNTKAIGYIGCQTVLDEGYITNVAVAPAHRRSGAASTLVAALIEQARQKALSFLTLEVRASNMPAFSLYEKQGFRASGVRKGFYSAPQEDALLMTLHFDNRSGVLI